MCQITPILPTPSSKTDESDVMKHSQNDELFAALKIARLRLTELRSKPETDVKAMRYWEQQQDSIMEKLILVNQGLVGSLVKKLRNFLEPDELEQVGNIALTKAIADFDSSRGNQFSTFAYLHIKGAMLRTINKSRIIRVPEEKIGQLIVLKRTMDRLRGEYEDQDEEGNEPSADELAWTMGIPVEQVRELLAFEQVVTSLDGFRNDANDVNQYEWIADTTAVAPTEEAEFNDDMRLLRQAVKTLAKRDANVFIAASGLFGHFRESYEKIGKKHGISSERARQIYQGAFDGVEAFIRSEKSKSAGKVAKRRLGMIHMQSSKVIATAAKLSAVADKPYRLKMRGVDKKNPNHHIWNNNGTWYCKFMLILANGERSQVCKSLSTKDVEVARRKRDVLIRLYKEPVRPEAA